jgi:hypothetical protein
MGKLKDAAKVRFFPPGIPLLSIFVGLVLNRIWPLADIFTIETPLRYYIGGMVVVGSIALLGSGR